MFIFISTTTKVAILCSLCNFFTVFNLIVLFRVRAELRYDDVVTVLYGVRDGEPRTRPEWEIRLDDKSSPGGTGKRRKRNPAVRKSRLSLVFPGSRFATDSGPMPAITRDIVARILPTAEERYSKSSSTRRLVKNARPRGISSKNASI